jgi:hypothetical protein
LENRLSASEPLSDSHSGFKAGDLEKIDMLNYSYIKVSKVNKRQVNKQQVEKRQVNK